MRCNDTATLKFLVYLLYTEYFKSMRSEEKKYPDSTYSKAKKLIEETTCVLEDIINEMKKLQCFDFSSA